MSERPVALALGSNLGDSLVILQGAVEALARVPGLRLDRASCVVETDPVGGPEQPDYLNAVVIGVTSLEPLDLLDAVQGIERDFARVRDVRWGPRTLDIDIIAMGDLEMSTARLDLPHPRAHERGFVLVPWFDADPSASIPGQARVGELLDSVGTDGVRMTEHRIRIPREEVS